LLLLLGDAEEEGSFDATSGCSAGGVPLEPQLTQRRRKKAVIALMKVC